MTASDVGEPGIALPGGVDRLTARAAELAVVAEDLKQALRTLTPEHPRVVELTKLYEERVEPLRKAIKAKLAELRSADTKLAEWYQPGHPERLAVTEQLRSLQDLLDRSFWDVGATPPALTLDLGGGVTMDLVPIPAGEFMMGSPSSEAKRNDDETRHRVRISKPFYMGKYEVTQAQWEAVMGTSGSQQRDKANKARSLHGEGAQIPMYYVSWEECREFCRKLSQKVSRDIRLPTEAEWEYACRAGTSTAYSFGDEQGSLGRYAWYTSNNDGESHPVGGRQPNGWGLYDMHGNVWEWCADWYDSEYYQKSPQADPTGPGSGAYRVLRGGSWVNHDYNCRSAYRNGAMPDYRSNDFGFRVAAGT